MENNIFDIAGKELPYVMPSGFDASKLMADAIGKEQKKKTVLHRIMWLGSSAAAAAVALLVVFMQPTMATADPVTDYHAALSQYCSSASDAELQKRIDMSESDYVANIDHYEAYYLN
ncbi:MAG: hypothetical protein MJZ29_00435 [Bacteroidaceae bacterium]|nr:hypothetical protein [Bacteroidaceae bacterium]